MQYNQAALSAANDSHMSMSLIRGPAFGVVNAKNDAGNAIADLFQAVVYRMNTRGEHEIARLSNRRVSYGDAFCEAAKMAGVPGYAG